MPPAGGVPTPWPRRFTTWFRATRTWRMTLFLDSRVLPHRQIHCALLSPRLEIRNKSPKAPKTNAAGRFHRRRGREHPGGNARSGRVGKPGRGGGLGRLEAGAPSEPSGSERRLGAGLPEVVAAHQRSASGGVERGQTCWQLACPGFRRQARREVPNPRPELRNSRTNFRRNFFSPDLS